MTIPKEVSEFQKQNAKKSWEARLKKYGEDGMRKIFKRAGKKGAKKRWGAEIVNVNPKTPIVEEIK